MRMITGYDKSHIFFGIMLFPFHLSSFQNVTLLLFCSIKPTSK